MFIVFYIKTHNIIYLHTEQIIETLKKEGDIDDDSG